MKNINYILSTVICILLMQITALAQVVVPESINNSSESIQTTVPKSGEFTEHQLNYLNPVSTDQIIVSKEAAYKELYGLYLHLKEIGQDTEPVLIQIEKLMGFIPPEFRMIPLTPIH